ncbi:hypothetical protein AAC387_Pa07g0335 [Persea americana]
MHFFQSQWNDTGRLVAAGALLTYTSQFQLTAGDRATRSRRCGTFKVMLIQRQMTRVNGKIVEMRALFMLVSFYGPSRQQGHALIREEDGTKLSRTASVEALSGFTASTISFPLEVVRKRLMVGSLQGKCPPHMAVSRIEVIQKEGLRGLYRSGVQAV